MELEGFSTLAPSRVRNFCMLAHVDHGKTTLSDFLLTANGLLSKQLAGKVRFLDSRPDEQERLITMKASCVALRHVVDGEEQLVHLVDSPGHIDFSSEVSTAMRMCDGALVVVDVIDGITIQTKAMLRQAFSEGLKMVLVINKLDLLISTLQLTPEEAYQRLEKIIQDCNVVISAYVNVLTIAGTQAQLLESNPAPEDEQWFNPHKGNVVFASGMDGYGFSLESIAKTWVSTGKLGSITAAQLQQALWGESYLDVKTMSILPKPKKEGQPPMAVTFVFEPIWAIHAMFKDDESFDESKVEKMTARLGVNDRVWKVGGSKRSVKDKMTSILSAWLPLAECLLDAVCHHLPSVVDGQKSRLSAMMPHLQDAAPATRDALLSADPNGPLVAYVGKLIDTEYLAGTCQYGDREKAIDDCFIGFARVFSGTLRPGAEVRVVSGNKVQTTTVGDLFLLRGQGLEPVTSVPPGRLCGISNMMPFIVKHGVITDDAALPEFNAPRLSSTSIVHYVLRPKQPANLGRLMTGLKLLYQTDPQVELAVLPTGEYVMGVAGEVHAERCVEDLNTTFARVEFHISPPIVQYRETLVAKSYKLKEFEAVTPCGGFSCSIAALPFPEEVVDAMCAASNTASPDFVEQVMSLLHGGKEAKKRPWDQALKSKTLGTAPSKYNFFGCALYDVSSLSHGGDVQGTASGEASPDTNLSAATSVTGDDADHNRTRALSHFREAIVSGFQLAAGAGPMAEEPMFGMAFFLTKLEVKAAAVPDAQAIAVLTRNVLSTVGNACRQAMQLHTNGMRIVEPIYECVVHSAGATQGKVYNILNRRRAEIDEEVMAEGGETYYIVSHLPVGESFGLQDELRIATSGAATAILRMDKWKIIDQDPYFRPTTKEEIEEYGTDGVIPNFAATLIEGVRTRKGIQKRNLVENAEKQKFSMRGA